jgi:TolB-like protein/DNA-binding winged helix-turn-helix (wHTH) protein
LSSSLDPREGSVPTVLESGFRIGPWEIRPDLGTLTGPDGEVHLEPKVMGVLLCLAEQAGEVVTRDQFVARVWRGRIVSDEVLSRCISLLRTSLGDDPREPQFIQTLPKIGYRLIVPVLPREPEPATSAAAAEAARPADNAEATIAPPRREVRRWRAAGPAAALLLAAASLYIYWQWFAGPDSASLPAALPSVVVLPFVNHSAERDNEYFSDGLTEELIDRLAQVPGLQVVASTSAFAFKNHREDVRSIAEQLGVSYVLAGNVRKEGDRVRITAQLIEARRGFHVWSERFDTTLGDIFIVQDDIANGIVAELRPRLSTSETAEPGAARPTEVMPAYELLLQGRYHLKRREEAPIRRSMELFEQAIELDPTFGDAYRELARAYVLLPTYSYEDEDEMFEMAVATIARGVAADPALEDSAHDVLALVHLNRWEWTDAEQDFRRGLAASPNDSNVRQWYSQLLASVGRPEESLHYILEAKTLDVLSPVVNDRLAVAYMWVDDDEQARQQFELADELGMGPTANPEAYIVLLLREGDYDKARELLIDLQKLFARAPDWIDPFIAALGDSAARPAAEEALATAAGNRNISLKYLFGAWIYLGNADAAMETAFELLYEPAEFDVEFLFARETEILRCHPRFSELVTAIGLDSYWDRFGWPALYARPGEVRECG